MCESCKKIDSEILELINEKEMIVEIPINTPFLKSQLESFNKCWPCQYCETIPETIPVDELKIEVKDSFIYFMKMVIDIARKSKDEGGKGIACIIVDMKNKEVMGKGISEKG